MKKRLFYIFSLILLLQISPVSCQITGGQQEQVEKKEVTVYVTNTGEKYHSAHCGYLHSSKIAMTLSEAKKSYTACSRCKGSPNYRPKTTSGTTSTAVQCSGTTKAGNRCKRRTTNSNGRCYQH